MDSIKIQCSEPGCEAKLLPQSLRTHQAKHIRERQCKETEKAVVDAKVNSCSGSSGTRVKRQAAKKAQVLFNNLVQQMNEKTEEEEEEKGDDEDENFSDDLNDENYNVCEELSVATLYRTHRSESGARKVVQFDDNRPSILTFDFYRVWRCNVCTSEFNAKEDVESHVVSDHSTELLADQGT